jgi:NHLM bacteriocin system ABC transporter peptidase/ATP-binding protein
VAEGLAKRVKTPTRLQMEAAECGSAALGIVLEYHGSYVPLEKLRGECGVSRDGSKASNVVKAARKYGMDSKGWRREPEQVYGLEMPVILHWNFNHFLVLEGFHKGKAFLNDPAMGPRSVTLAEFDQAFTGVVLTFQPNDDFVPTGKKPSAIPSLMSRLRGSKDALLFVILAGIALIVPGLVIPVFSKIFVDDILVAGKQDWLRPLLLAMAVTVFVQAFLVWLRERYLLLLSMKLSITMSGQFLWHVLRLPIRFFEARFPGDIANRIQSNDSVAGLLSGQLATTVLDGILVVFYCALMFCYDVWLTVVSIAIASINIVLLRWIARRRVDLALRVQVERGKLMGVAMSGLTMIESLKASGAENDFFAKWGGHHAKLSNAQQRMAVLARSMGTISPLLMTLNTVVILGVGSLRVMDGHMTMGMLVAYQALVAAFLAPINGLIRFADAAQNLQGDLSQLDDVLNHQEADHLRSSDGERISKARLEGRLGLHCVSFGYNPLAPALIDNLELSLTPGSRVALVGGSGSGKSTVAKLVCGLEEPWSGQILFDGKGRGELPRRQLTASLAAVSQEIFLFEGSVRENLTMWDETIPESRIVQAAKDACIHDDILAIPGGYDGYLQEGGRNLSGGQRQRLEIARALCGMPTLLVLDEATSALDPETEMRVDQNIRRRGCTCLIVAHRLSTIRDCDEIIVLDRGKVVERGTHESLRDAQGQYAQLVLST